VLTELQASLRPLLTARYQDLVKEWTGEHLADLPEIAAAYQHYTEGDAHLNRPLLTLVGYGARRDCPGPELLDELGPLVFVPQLVRDFFAIHDDMVDGDLVKFDRLTLPAALGLAAALFTADLLPGIAADLIDRSGRPAKVKCRLHRLVGEILRRTQQGQLAELALARRAPATIPADVIVRVYAYKAAAYCYVFPFEFGSAAAGNAGSPQVRRALEDIGTASQIVDDLLGNLPDGAKDTPGEILRLHRTVLLTQLAVRLDRADPLSAVITGTSATPEQADAIRTAFTATGAAAATAATAAQLAHAAEAQLATLPLSAPVTAYLSDLVRARIHDTLVPWAAPE
jgi:geranylgeranyl pyrophosphate synthase